MGRCKLFWVTPGRNGGLIKPAEPAHRVPERSSRIPGYADRAQEVAAGRLAPWWGEEYASVRNEPDLPMGDLVDCLPMPVYAVSERLKRVLLDGGVAGLRFSSVRVDGVETMHIVGVEGRVAVNPQAFELQLLDGAEVGLRDWSFYTNARVVALLRREEMDVRIKCMVKEKGS